MDAYLEGLLILLGMITLFRWIMRLIALNIDQHL